MAKAKGKKITLEDALVPADEQPYQVPENWCWVQFGAVCIFENGYAFKSDCFSDVSGVPVVRISNIVDDVIEIENCVKSLEENIDTRFVVHRGDLLIAMSGATTGKNGVYYSDKLAYLNQRVGNIKIVNDRILLHGYRNLFVKFKTDEILRNAYGGAQPNISSKKICEMYMPLPPLAEQQRIVGQIENLFSKLDEAKEKAQAVVDSFETRKAAILHKAFTGNLIGKDNVALVPLESIVDEIRIGPFGSALHEEDYIVDGIPVINPKHITNQMINPQSKVTISAEKVLELQTYRLKINDIVLGRRGEMGRVAPVTSKEEGWLCGTGSMIIRLKKEYQAKFYSLIISSQASVQYLERHAVGTTLKNLNEKIVRQLLIPDFTIEEQNKLFYSLDSLLSKEQQAKEAAEAVLGQIDTMKQTILVRAFRSELGTNNPEEESSIVLLKHIFE